MLSSAASALGQLEDLAAEDFAVEVRRERTGSRIHAAHDLRIFRQVFDNPAHQQPFGTERDVEIDAELLARRFEPRGEFTAGRAHWQRGVEDAEGARPEALGRLFRGREQILEVGPARGVHVHADCEKDHLGLGNGFRGFGRRCEGARGNDLAQHRIEAGFVRDRVLATVHAFDESGVHVAAEDPVAL